jgi:hypothetical protein
MLIAWPQMSNSLSSETVWTPQPTERHAAVLSNLLALPGVHGNLAPNAHLAVLAIEHGLTLCSTDGDFARFPGLTLVRSARGVTERSTPPESDLMLMLKLNILETRRATNTIALRRKGASQRVAILTPTRGSSLDTLSARATSRKRCGHNDSSFPDRPVRMIYRLRQAPMIKFNPSARPLV